MPKPSIFSKNYEKNMKMRRKKKAIVIVFVAILIFAIYIILATSGKNQFMNNIVKKINWVQNKENAEDKKIKKTIDDEKKIKEVSKDKEKEEKKNKEEYINLSITESLSLKLFYSEVNGKKTYTNVENNNLNNDVDFDINPSKSSVLIYEKLNQKIFLVDNLGKVTDISKEKLTTSKGYIYERYKVIQLNKNYVWCSNPRFIDDNNIVFISELPYIKNGSNKFIWYGNVANKTYKYIRSLKGMNLEFQNITDNGIAVKIDDKIYFINAEGRVVKA
ncbi:hypothetical protein ACER0A_008420 [Haloimpatiens sp. FM7315]|uniref:hypothetical protein n=1 Tax=Haloimpatiens sp. FM7315 TaxID=3298609 RepID=UPI00370C8FF9